MSDLFTITEAQLHNSPHHILVELCVGLVNTANTLNRALDDTSRLIEAAVTSLGTWPAQP